MLSTQTKRRNIYIVLPAFNEAGKIGQLIQSIAEVMEEFGFPYHILVVDDGSSDKTINVVEDKKKLFSVECLRHAQNQGLGASVRDGLFHIAERAHERDIIITMDADDTHPPGSILHMVRMIYEGYDVVIASRFVRGARIVGVPFFRQILSIGASLLVQILFPIPGVKDYTCGYRAYRANIIKKAFALYGDEFISEGGFQCMIDILLKLRSMRVIIGEVPFVLRYDNKVGKSKLPVMSTIVNTFALLLKRMFVLKKG